MGNLKCQARKVLVYVDDGYVKSQYYLRERRPMAKRSSMGSTERKSNPFVVPAMHWLSIRAVIESCLA